LQCLTGLEYFSIDNAFSQSNFSSDHVKLLASILDKIPSSTLKTIDFGIYPIPPPSPPIKEWHRIGEVLQQSRFSHLTELVFSLHTSERGNGHLEESIRGDLRALEERGILSFRNLLSLT
jgi:hypothetical protein